MATLLRSDVFRRGLTLRWWIDPERIDAQLSVAAVPAPENTGWHQCNSAHAVDDGAML
jgi:hypothetical protein